MLLSKITRPYETELDGNAYWIVVLAIPFSFEIHLRKSHMWWNCYFSKMFLFGHLQSFICQSFFKDGHYHRTKVGTDWKMNKMLFHQVHYKHDWIMGWSPSFHGQYVLICWYSEKRLRKSLDRFDYDIIDDPVLVLSFQWE